MCWDSQRCVKKTVTVAHCGLIIALKYWIKDVFGSNLFIALGRKWHVSWLWSFAQKARPWLVLSSRKGCENKYIHHHTFILSIHTQWYFYLIPSQREPHIFRSVALKITFLKNILDMDKIYSELFHPEDTLDSVKIFLGRVHCASRFQLGSWQH